MSTLPLSSAGTPGLASYPLANPADTTKPTKVNNNQTAVDAPRGSALAQRVNKLGTATVNMAQDFLQGFAQQLFGDQAKGMKVDFDSVELSASSTASAAAMIQRGAQGTDAAAAFRLEDASSFKGKGTLTTADGRTFEFEIEVRYESVQEAAYAYSDNQQQVNNGGDRHRHRHDDDAAKQATAPFGGLPTPQPANVDGLRNQFGGTADELLSQLSAEPVRQPFSLDLPQEDGNPLKLLGDLALRLLDLTGGPRYVDLAKVGKDDADDKKGVSVKA